MDLSKRSYQKELLDRDDIPFDEIEKNMQELNFINTWLGGHAITVSGLKQLLRSRLSRNQSPLDTRGSHQPAGDTGASGDKQIPLTVSICEIGAGGGDN